MKLEAQIRGRTAGRLVVKKARCPQNHPCPSLRVCPAGALSQQGFAAPVVNRDKCILCGKCVKYCPKGALQIEAAADEGGNEHVRNHNNQG